jgi:hypothetical protein
LTADRWAEAATDTGATVFRAGSQRPATGWSCTDGGVNPPLKAGRRGRNISSIMKVLLRNEQTGSYVGREAAWAKEVERAAEFETLEAAIQKTLQYEKDDVVIVLRAEGPSADRL